jgi:hypothetical protein
MQDNVTITIPVELANALQKAAEYAKGYSEYHAFCLRFTSPINSEMHAGFAKTFDQISSILINANGATQ